MGLGNLGKTMAKRLLSEGVDLAVWNRTREKALDIGCPITETPAALAKATDIVFLNLFDSKAVQSVLFDQDGLTRDGLKDKVVVDTTTNHFEWVPHFHRSVSDQGGRYLEAPVLKDWRIYFSGNPFFLFRIKFVLDTIGDEE